MKHGEKTRQKILETGLEMWLKNPNSVTANGIAKRLGLVHAAVLYHFPDGVKDAVAAYAVEQQCAPVIAQLIVNRHPTVAGMDAVERAEWLAKL